MKKPKKRNKQYDRTLKFRELGALEAKHYSIFDVTRLGVSIYKDLKLVRIGKTTANMLNEIRHKWKFIIGVICKDNFGKYYFKSEIIESKEEYFTIEIADKLNEHQTRLWNESNSNHRRTLFWIGTLGAVDDITDEWIDKELTAMNAYDVVLGTNEIKDIL